MSGRRRGKTTSGWAAFALEQQAKRGLEPVADAEPYPSLSSSIASQEHGKNSTRSKNSGLNGAVLQDKPFVSVVVRTVDFQVLTGNERTKAVETRSRLGGESSSHQGFELAKKTGEEFGLLEAAKKLEEHFPWAERSLIEDVLVGVDNNIDEASSMLEVMESSIDNKAETEDLKFCSEESVSNVNKAVASPKTSDFVDPGSANEDCDKRDDMKKDVFDNRGFLGDMLFSDGTAVNTDLCNMMFYRSEPEFEEEDDVYVVHRKDAIRIMRSASHHSKAATDAYFRGDHLSAQYYSQKAREEWIAAQRLNGVAAKEILRIRNSANDLWTLDLHGLHSTEAIQALQEHLMKIESSLSSNNTSVDRSSRMANNPLPSSVDSERCHQRMKGSDLPPSSRKLALQVITGKGNHSRGQAALPAAVKSFLNENEYRYDESRPGVITVRPKFRRG